MIIYLSLTWQNKSTDVLSKKQKKKTTKFMEIKFFSCFVQNWRKKKPGHLLLLFVYTENIELIDMHQIKKKTGKKEPIMTTVRQWVEELFFVIVVLITIYTCSYNEKLLIIENRDRERERDTPFFVINKPLYPIYESYNQNKNTFLIHKHSYHTNDWWMTWKMNIHDW